MKSYLIVLLLGFSSLIQSQNKPSLLHQYLKSESEDILRFGNESVWASEKNIVLKDFAKIDALTSINSANYKIETIQEGKHLITIYKANSKIKPYKIVEVITRDSTEYKGTRIHLEQIRYLILSKSNPKKVELDISENGIDGYTINGQRKYCLRESIVYIPEEFDVSVFHEMDAIMEKYKDK